MRVEETARSTRCGRSGARERPPDGEVDRTTDVATGGGGIGRRVAIEERCSCRKDGVLAVEEVVSWV